MKKKIQLCVFVCMHIMSSFLATKKHILLFATVCMNPGDIMLSQTKKNKYHTLALIHGI